MQEPRLLFAHGKFYIEWYTKQEKIKNFEVTIDVVNFSKQYPHIEYRKSSVLFTGKRKKSPEIKWNKKGTINVFIVGGGPEDIICYLRIYEGKFKKYIDCIFMLENADNMKDFVKIEF